MKPIVISCICICISAALFSQSYQPADKSGTHHRNSVPLTPQFPVEILGPGDTLLFIPFRETYVNPDDAPYFNLYAQDLDNHICTSTNGFPDPDWGFFYSTDSADFLPGEAITDSAFFLAATSWFNTPAQADNWLELGPITVPATGAQLSWYVRNNPEFRDGYEVLAGNIGYANYTDFFDVIYQRADLTPNPNDATDTIWQKVTVDIPATYNNGPLYIAFHHTAFDMDVLYLDQITLTVGNMTKTGEENNASLQVQPFISQPGTLTFRITTPGKINGTLSLADMNGRTVSSRDVQVTSAGITDLQQTTEQLQKGVYAWVFRGEGIMQTGKIVL